MDSLHNILSQRTPSFRTRQALIVLGLQNDFVSPNGKLPVATGREYIERIRELVPAFRDHGEILWVRSEYHQDRPVNDPMGNACTVILKTQDQLRADDIDVQDSPRRERNDRRSTNRLQSRQASDRTMQALQRILARTRGLESDDDDPATSADTDEELFLSQTPERSACCIPGSVGADYIPAILDLQRPRDVQVTKTYYSAFRDTSLLDDLRTKLITELFVVGNMTNLSVYASAMDAARHGMSINIVEDCLGYRSIARHQEAINQLVEQMGASITSSRTLLSRLRGDDDTQQDDPTQDADQSSDDDDSSGQGPRPHHDGDISAVSRPSLSAASISRFLSEQSSRGTETQDHSNRTEAAFPTNTSHRTHQKPSLKRKASQFLWPSGYHDHLCSQVQATCYTARDRFHRRPKWQYGGSKECLLGRCTFRLPQEPSCRSDV